MARAISRDHAKGPVNIASIWWPMVIAVAAIAAALAVRHQSVRPAADNAMIAGLTYETTAGQGVDHALVVTSVQSDSPAAAAGIVSGDVIALVDGVPVHSSRDIMRAIEQHPSRMAKLRVLHGAYAIDNALPLAAARDK